MVDWSARITAGSEDRRLTGRTILALLVALPLAGEMLFQLRSIGTNYYKMIPVYMAACLYYLITTSLMMWGQSWLEKRFGRGFGTTVSSDAEQAAKGLAAGSAK